MFVFMLELIVYRGAIINKSLIVRYVTVSIFCISCLSCSQSEESKTKHVKASFIKTADKASEFNKVLEDHLKFKRPTAYKKGIDGKFRIYSTSAYDDTSPSESMEWMALYYEFENNYEYNIEKTTSIISPYIATLKFKTKTFMKEGKTELEVNNAKWVEEVYPPGSKKNINISHYAYQNGNWVYK